MPNVTQEVEPQRAVPPFTLAPGEGMSVENPIGVTTFKATSDQSGGGLTAIEGVPAPGEGPPLHVHREQDEFIWTLEGMFRVRLGDDLIEAPPGTFVFVPRNTPHSAARRLNASIPRSSGGSSARAMEVVGPPLAQSDG